MTLREAWDREAANWLAWAREPGHDSYWTFHRDAFLDLLPPSAGLTVDVGCGEGRLPRDLQARGYEVIGVDASADLIQHAREADPGGDYRVSDAAALPLPDASATLVIAFMSLHDVDDLDAAVHEIARVMQPDAVLAAAIVHPINSAGAFLLKDDDAAFQIETYLEEWDYTDVVERNGLRMNFSGRHRPLEAYFAALGGAGLVVDRLVEVPAHTDPAGSRWRRIPLFLHIRAHHSGLARGTLAAPPPPSP